MLPGPAWQEVVLAVSQRAMRYPSNHAMALSEQHGRWVSSGESVCHAKSKQLCKGSLRAAWQVIVWTDSGVAGALMYAAVQPRYMSCREQHDECCSQRAYWFAACGSALPALCMLAVCALPETSVAEDYGDGDLMMSKLPLTPFHLLIVSKRQALRHRGRVMVQSGQGS